MGELKNLSRQEAVDKIKELSKDIGICMFCTELTVLPIATRPMSVEDVDDQGNLWFISSRKSNKNFEIKHDDRVQLIFSKSAEAKFLSVYGNATVYRDKATIEAIWSPMDKAWFEEGKDDPDVTVIKVSPSDAYYWDTESGKVVSLLKIAASAITGAKADGGVEGHMSL